MRKLLNTLFVLSEDSYLALEGETVTVLGGAEKRGQFPLHTLESILCFSYKGASPALMGACAKRGVNLVFLSPQGRFLARSCGEDRGNVLLRRQQYRLSEDAAQSGKLAHSFIFGKVHNCRWTLERTLRDHGLRVDGNALKAASRSLADALPDILEAGDPDALRGLEGQAANIYFGVFDHLLLNQKESFSFQVRSRRPPLDRINALLSFAYTLLANDCAAALEAVGLDAYVGFLHRDRPGRASLALDLMEELRPVLADRFVVTLVNNRAVKADDFLVQEDGAVLLTDSGRRAFLTAWQNRKREALTHPFLKEKLAWGLVPYVQALLLARHLRDDLDGYPPFFGSEAGMLVLITYDVNTEDAEGRRRRQVARQCVNYGQRVQNSVFECLLDAAQCRQVQAKLLAIIDPNRDSLRFYYLGNRYETKVEHFGVRQAYAPEGVLMV